MKQYVIKKKERVDWENVEKGYIDMYPWGNEYTPEAFFQAIYTNDAVIVKLTCMENDPKAVYSEYMSPVYKDSCLEFFASYANGGYINCEMNSKGACLIAYGAGRGGRIPIKDICGTVPKVESAVLDGVWCATVTMPFDILKSVYGDVRFTSGYEFYGNAYKCGDDCEISHYGMWNAATCEKPDFHRPEFFGKFILE